ncbi:MAG: malto-oligosyltrehalose synthase [Pseudomonadota bacterium]
MKIPSSTYRLQFGPSFTFSHAQSIVDYLSELGISDIYASPIFKARKGSTHGYDVVDFNRINPEVGGEEGLDRLTRDAAQKGLGWIQDFIPNHMAYDSENQMIIDLLENGEASAFFDYFDIEWDHPYEYIRGKVLAPFLGEFYGTCLENGEIRLLYDEEGFAVEYYERRFPLKTETYVNVLTYNWDDLKQKLQRSHPDFIKYLGVLYILKNLPATREELKERYDQIHFVKIELWGLYSKNKKIKSFIDGNIRAFNGEQGRPESFNLLDNLLSEQLFRLSFWKVATEEVNYRRFFTINDLISLRMEDEQVFRETHALIAQLVEEKKITGIRIDHIDGLYDPSNYLARLKVKMGDVYTVVEKILDMEEDIPDFWPVQGTTGYDFLNYVNQVFCESKNEKKMDRIYFRFIGNKIDFRNLVRSRKGLIIDRDMTGDLDRLARLMKTISGKDRHGSDLTHYGLKKALVEFLLFFPVYRTYVSADSFTERDRAYIRETVETARELRPRLLYEFLFIEKFLLSEFGEYLTDEEKEEWISFAMRLQQLTGPLMAKGFEDTALYIYNRLISLNEVGGSPQVFGITPMDFHAFNNKRNNHWPHSMNATATHDTKRGEDVRARVNVLSEIPDEWEQHLKKWSRLNARRKKTRKGKPAPDRNDEYLLYQTLIGAFPFHGEDYGVFVKRIKDYMIKAVREAKIHTAWLRPDTEYEDLLLAFIDKILAKTEQNLFLREFEPFQKKIAHYGIFNSLSQTLLKIAAPGIPDFYQGSELWDLNLVDPDNRRPVDFAKRETILNEIKEKEAKNRTGLIRELLLNKKNGNIKLFLIYRGLKARSERKRLFENGEYVTLTVEGKHKDHVVAFLRKRGDQTLITAVPRFVTMLVAENEFPLGDDVWGDTHVSVPKGGAWKDVFTEREIEVSDKLPVGEVFNNFPVALLFN